ncbi:MAG: ABC transporter substrate-binding protein [Chloroflexi bacterium]|nr:ABC transporter substrate-binding protein [Chloroflexota bacterium]
MRILASILVGLVLLGTACATAAPPPKAEQKAVETKPATSKPATPPITIRYATAIAITDRLPLYAAEEKGFLKGENIDLEVTVISTGDKLLSALIGGSVDVAYYTPDVMIRAVEQGEKLSIVLGGTSGCFQGLSGPGRRAPGGYTTLRTGTKPLRS